MEIKTRFIILISVSLLFAIGVTGLTVTMDYRHRFSESELNLAKIAESQANLIQTLYFETADKDLIIRTISQVFKQNKTVSDLAEIDVVENHADSITYWVVNKQNKVFHHLKAGEKDPIHLLLKEIKADYRTASFSQRKDSEQMLYSFHKVEGLNWYIVVKQSIETIRRPFRQTMIIVSAISIIVICIAIFIFWLIIYPVIKKEAESEENFKQLIENINEVFLLRNNKKFIFVSSTFYTLLGYDPAVILDNPQKWVDLVHPQDREQLFETSEMQSSAVHDSCIEFRAFCADGSMKWIEAKTYPVKGQYNDRRATVLTDITERRNLIASIKLSEAKYKTIFYTCPDAILINEMNGTFIDVNDIFSKISGYDKKSVIGMTTLELNIWMSDADKEKIMSELETNWHFSNLEFNFRIKNDKIITCLLSSTILEIEGKKTILSIARDITDRKAIEVELTNAKIKAEESDNLKTAFLNNISHEFRTPINSIVGFSELIAYTDLNKEKYALYSSQIINGCNKLIEIVSLTVEMSQIQSMQVKYYESFFNLTSLISKVKEDYEEKALEKNLEFVVQTNFQQHNSSIFSDFNKLYKTIKYVVDNAVKFTKQGSVCLSCLLENGHLLVSVQDTGIGISEEMQPKVFDIFRQVETGLSRSFGGNGLGLSIAKAYVEVMNGKIWLESEIDKGTTVYFTVPALVSKHLTVKQPTLVTDVDWSKKTVLIAEDETSNFDLLSEILQPSKIKVLHAKNGNEAIQLVLDNQVDIVLMDVKMPEMDGISATKRIRKIKNKLTIIAVTSFTNETIVGQTFSKEFDEMLSKPINGHALVQMIGKYLERNS